MSMASHHVNEVRCTRAVSDSGMAGANLILPDRSGAVPSLLGSCSGRVPNRVLLPGGEEGVGDLGDLRHRADAVDADDMGTGQDAGGDGGGGAPLALVGWDVTECQGQEGLARG